jgi:hypothetical protein
MNSTDMKSPAEVGAELCPYRPDEPTDWLSTYSRRLLEWDDACQRAWHAQITGTPAERLAADVAEMEAFDRLNVLKEHIAASFALAVRVTRDLDFRDAGVPGSVATAVRDELAFLRSIFSDSIQRIRDDLAELADYVVTLERRGAAA